MPENLSEFLTLALCLGIPTLVGAIAGAATAQSVGTWYVRLRKPSFNPPNSVFAPVWTTLYLLMGISLYMIWRSPHSLNRDLALIAFGVQMALNAAWSVLFFRFRLIGFALAEIILLWVSILVMILLFHRVNRDSAWLQIPYLLWVTFAAVLNASIRAKNPGPAGREDPVSGIPGRFRPD